MKEATELALQMLHENVEAMHLLDSDREKVATRFKIATTAARLAECDKCSQVSHKWIGTLPPVHPLNVP